MSYDYSTVEQVRKQAGDPHPEDVTDEDIQEEIDAVGELIDFETGTEWDSTMKGWKLVKRITKYLAAAFVMEPFDDPKGEVEKNLERGERYLGKLVVIDTGAGDIVVTSPDYKTFPLNPNAAIPRGRISPLSHIEVAVDPDDIYEQEF